MNPDAREKVEVIDRAFADIPAGATMYVGTPQVVADYISHIPYGHTTTLQQMRKDLAAEHRAEYCCPITAGIFLRIVAEAAYEQYVAGAKISELAPFWRMIDRRTPVAKKLSFGYDFVAERRRAEGLPE